MEPDIKKKTQTQSMEAVPETIASKVQERIKELKFTRGHETSDWQQSGKDFIMNIWDFGGQPIYHVIQRIFMISFAIVCVVFNLEDDLDAPARVRDPTTGDIYEHRMTNLEFILYWIRSAYSNSRDSELGGGQPSPPVLVIGTHLGSLEGNKEEQERKAEEIFNKIRQALEGKPYEALVFSTFFAIENSLPFARSNAPKIMDQILKFAKKMVRKLPLKWLRVQQEIQKLKVKHIYLPTKEVITLVERCGVRGEAQRVLLEYLHDIGEILYFPDDYDLMDIIVLDLMTVVDMFKTIITVIDPKLWKLKHRKAWRRLDSGILEEHLLRHLWEKFNFSDATFDFFVSLMQKFGLVCEKKIAMSGERIFYVLSRLKPEGIDTSSSKDYGKRAISIFHDFGRYLPDDIFQRGVTKFIERFQIENYEPTLSYEHVELDIDQGHHVVMSVASIKHRRMFQTTIIRQKMLSSNMEDEPSPTVCKEVLNFLETVLNSFYRRGSVGLELTRYICCSKGHMHIMRTFDKDVLPCGCHGLEVTRYRRLFGDSPDQSGTVATEFSLPGSVSKKNPYDALAEVEIEVSHGKAFFLGLEGVGKSSTIKSFLRNTFTPVKDITEGIVKTTVCSYSHDELNWKETSQDKWQQPMGSATEVEPGIKKYKQTQSMEEIPESSNSKVQEKLDAPERTSGATSELQTSGKHFRMWDMWDFKGHPIYSGIQQVFLVSFAIVCVLFNLEDDLEAPANVRDPTTGEMYQHQMTNLQFILYWIRSVYTNSRDSELDEGKFSPSVLVIGTHLGSLEGNNQEEKEAKAETIFNKIRQALEGKPYETMVFSTFFAVENSLPFSRSNASKIMNHILKLVKRMVRKLPLKWLHVLQEIKKLKVKHIYLPANEVIALVEQVGVKQGAQRALLEYLHNLGEILYFPDDEALKHIIVLDLIKIFNMFEPIITVVDPKIVKPMRKDAWRTLNSGILKEHLLRNLWKEFDFSDTTFDFFVSLMQKLGLVSQKITAMGGERIFYVFSRLKSERIPLPTMDYGRRAVSIFHDFGHYLPDDLFQHGVTKFIERFQVKDNEPTLSYEHVELDIDDLHHVVMSVASIKHRRMFETTIIRRKILGSDMEDEPEPSPSVCKKVLSFLEKELNNFCWSSTQGLELTRYIHCINGHMHIMRKFDKDVLPCGSHGMMVTRYRRLFGDDPDQPDLPQPQGVVTVPTGFVDDAIIQTVSEEMDFSWRRFGVRLGLTWSNVNRYHADERMTHRAVENMLDYWRSSIDRERHQLNMLSTALRQHGTKFWCLADSLSDSAIWDDATVITKRAEFFDDRDLLFICDNLMPYKWRSLGVRLGLTWSDIKDIADNNRRVEDSILDILVTWRNGQPKTKQMPIMINALRQQKLFELAQRVCERHGYKELEVATACIDITHHVEGQLTDIDMLFVAERLGIDWKTFGVVIGLELSDIARFEMDFAPPVVDAIMEMLVMWRQRQKHSDNQLVAISNALDTIERGDIKEELQNYYMKKYQKDELK